MFSVKKRKHGQVSFSVPEPSNPNHKFHASRNRRNICNNPSAPLYDRLYNSRRTRSEGNSENTYPLIFVIFLDVIFRTA